MFAMKDWTLSITNNRLLWKKGHWWIVALSWIMVDKEAATNSSDNSASPLRVPGSQGPIRAIWAVHNKRHGCTCAVHLPPFWACYNLTIIIYHHISSYASYLIIYHHILCQVWVVNSNCLEASVENAQHQLWYRAAATKSSRNFIAATGTTLPHKGLAGIEPELSHGAVDPYRKAMKGAMKRAMKSPAQKYHVYLHC